MPLNNTNTKHKTVSPNIQVIKGAFLVASITPAPHFNQLKTCWHKHGQTWQSTCSLVFILISRQQVYFHMIWTIENKNITLIAPLKSSTLECLNRNFCSTHGSCLHTQVTNTNKDTSLKWFKEDRPVTQAVYDRSSGDSSLTIPKVVTASALRSDSEVMNKHYLFQISCGFMKKVFFSPQVTKKDAGSYRAAVSDKRGEDVSTLQLLGDGETRNSVCSGAELSEADVFASYLTCKQTWACCH